MNYDSHEFISHSDKSETNANYWNKINKDILASSKSLISRSKSNDGTVTLESDPDLYEPLKTLHDLWSELMELNRVRVGSILAVLQDLKPTGGTLVPNKISLRKDSFYHYRSHSYKMPVHEARRIIGSHLKTIKVGKRNRDNFVKLCALLPKDTNVTRVMNEYMYYRGLKTHPSNRLFHPSRYFHPVLAITFSNPLPAPIRISSARPYRSRRHLSDSTESRETVNAIGYIKSLQINEPNDVYNKFTIELTTTLETVYLDIDSSQELQKIFVAMYKESLIPIINETIEKAQRQIHSAKFKLKRVEKIGRAQLMIRALKGS